MNRQAAGCNGNGLKYEKKFGLDKMVSLVSG